MKRLRGSISEVIILIAAFVLALGTYAFAAPGQGTPAKSASPTAAQFDKKGVTRKIAGTMIMNCPTLQYNDMDIEAKLLDPDGKPLQNKEVCWQYVKFGGKNYCVRTNANGVAHYSGYSTAVPGTYDYKAFFEGDETAPPAHHTCTLTITRAKTRFDSSKVKAVYHSNDPNNLAARLNLDIRDLVFTTVNHTLKVPFVSFQIKWPGMTTAPITVNTYGDMSDTKSDFKWKASGLPAPGQTSYQFTAEFAGTDKYAPTSHTFSIPFSSLTYEPQY